MIAPWFSRSPPGWLRHAVRDLVGQARRFLTVDGVAGQFRAVRGPGDGGKETPPPSGRRHLGALNAKHGPALAKAARSVSAYAPLLAGLSWPPHHSCRDVARISIKPRRPPTPLTADELRRLHQWLSCALSRRRRSGGLTG